ncbi:MAG TPA: tetratricopeptide repeat protein, partial [Gemmataceae bacterium]
TGGKVGPPLPTGRGNALFLPGSGDLVTYAEDGPVLRWPWTDRGGAATLGPPRWLSDGPHDPEAIPVASPDGAWLAYTAADRAVVVHTADPTRRFVLAPHPRQRYLSFGPGGRRLASGTWNGRDVLVREVDTGRVVHRVEGGSTRGWLSADGRRLATIGEGYALRLWDAESWAPVADPIPSDGLAGAFSPDGRRLALDTAAGVVQLLDAADGRPLAQLELPVPAKSMHLAFSPVGDRLALATMDQFAAVWDLAAVRRVLAGMGLDWEDSPPPPPTPIGPPPRVEVVGADLAADPAAVRRAERDQLALTLWANPFDAGSYFERGRLLALDGQLAAAHLHFTAAVALRPDRPAVRQARLGTAVRLERWADVLADADALAGHAPDTAGLRYARAQALHGLGQHSAAAAAFGRLIAASPRDPDLYLRRAECYDALGRPADAAADRKRAEELAANSPLMLNNLAWGYANGPAAGRDPKRAVALARRAVAARPEEALYLNTLGVALYRAGEYAEAVTVLENSLKRSDGESDGWDLFVLAMCRHRLGEHERAEAAFARAVAWAEKQTQLNDRERAELAAFRAEAEGLLR